MSQKVLLDLAMKLSADSAELKRGLAESNRSMRQLQSNSANVGQQVVTAFAKIGAAVMAARGAVRQMTDIMNSTMTTADTLRRTTDGLSGAMGAFNRSLATGDFDGFIANLRNAYNAAADYSDILDELTKKQMAVSLQDIATATEVFRLDQIIYDDSSSEQEAMGSLKKKEELYRNHYAEVLRLAEINRDAILDRMRQTFQVSEEDAQVAYDYVINYNQFDEARDAANEYFAAIEKLNKAHQTNARLQGAGGQAAYSFDDLQYMRRNADSVYDTLQGMGKWLVDNESLIDFVTPINEEIIAAEQAIMQGTSTLEQRLATIVREERRIGNRFRSERNRAAGTETTTPTDPTPTGPGLGEPLLPDFVEKQIRIAINQGDYQNAILSLQVLQEELNRLSEIRLTMSPSDEGYSEINTALENIRNRMTEITSIGLTEHMEEEMELVEEKVEELRQSMINWESVSIGATQAVANAFLDMAMGIEVSIKSILQNLGRMVLMQLISSGVSALFNPVAAVGGGASQLFTPNAGALNGGLNLTLPKSGLGGFGGGGSMMGGMGKSMPVEVMVSGAISNDVIMLSSNKATARKNMIE